MATFGRRFLTAWFGNLRSVEAPEGLSGEEAREPQQDEWWCLDKVYYMNICNRNSYLHYTIVMNGDVRS